MLACYLSIARCMTCDIDYLFSTEAHDGSFSRLVWSLVLVSLCIFTPHTYTRTHSHTGGSANKDMKSYRFFFFDDTSCGSSLHFQREYFVPLCVFHLIIHLKGARLKGISVDLQIRSCLGPSSSTQPQSVLSTVLQLCQVFQSEPIRAITGTKENRNPPTL